MVGLPILGLLLCGAWGFALPLAMADVGPLLVVDATSPQRIALGKQAQIRHMATDERWRSQSESISLGFSPDLHELEFRYEVAMQGAESNWLLDLGSGSIRHIHLQHFVDEELVERMGGVMTLRSRPDKGSCFRFSLCLEACAAPPEPQPDSNQATADLSPFKVLAVEDNKTNQLLIRAMLQKSGIQFQLAENGREAVQVLEQVRVDMVLMDCQMPEMDGYAATQAIREELGLRHLPIVALTANASSEDRTRCIATGMSDFLTKPVRYQQLLDVLHKWVPPVHSETEAATPTSTEHESQRSPSLLKIE